MELNHKDWKGTTGGMPWMQRALVRCLRVTDLHIFYIILIFVVPFYMLFAHKGYMAQYKFFREGFKMGRRSAFMHVYENHFRFGQIIIDRFAAFSGKKFKFVYDYNFDEYEKLCNAEEGFLQLSSHVGNYELAGYCLKQPRKKMYALVYMGETSTVMQNRAKMFSPNGVEMVPVQSDMGHIFALNNALRDGDIASMPGDRIFGSPKSISCTFLNHTVQLPLGPFSLAVSRDVPVVAAFVMKDLYDTYHIYVRKLEIDESKLSQSGVLRKREKMQMLAQLYATSIEEIIRLYPNQWFNYFNFWV